jgi:hypothetical protein
MGGVVIACGVLSVLGIITLIFLMSDRSDFDRYN